MPRYDFIAVYLLASQKRGTLYVGVTSDHPQRIEEHRSGRGSKFTSAYRVFKLVWFERHERMDSALQRERQLKEWKRLWKIELIEATNPTWEDLSHELLG